MQQREPMLPLKRTHVRAIIHSREEFNFAGAKLIVGEGSHLSPRVIAISIAGHVYHGVRNGVLKRAEEFHVHLKFASINAMVRSW